MSTQTIPTNRPQVLATGAVVVDSLMVVANSQSPGSAAVLGAAAALVVTDAASLSDGTVLLNCPAALIPLAGWSIPFGGLTTTNGLVVQQIPPGVCVQATLG